ncbi:MAG: hypothetical protein ABJP45_18795 [Cyclobacteriaceae bacterium]
MKKKELRKRQKQNYGRLVIAIIALLMFLFLTFNLVITDSISEFGYGRFLIVLIWPCVFSILFWKFMVEEKNLKDLGK